MGYAPANPAMTGRVEEMAVRMHLTRPRVPFKLEILNGLYVGLPPLKWNW